MTLRRSAFRGLLSLASTRYYSRGFASMTAERMAKHWEREMHKDVKRMTEEFKDAFKKQQWKEQAWKEHCWDQRPYHRHYYRRRRGGFFPALVIGCGIIYLYKRGFGEAVEQSLSGDRKLVATGPSSVENLLPLTNSTAAPKRLSKKTIAAPSEQTETSDKKALLQQTTIDEISSDDSLTATNSDEIVEPTVPSMPSLPPPTPEISELVEPKRAAQRAAAIKSTETLSTTGSIPPQNQSPVAVEDSTKSTTKELLRFYFSIAVGAAVGQIVIGLFTRKG